DHASAKHDNLHLCLPATAEAAAGREMPAGRCQARPERNEGRMPERGFRMRAPAGPPRTSIIITHLLRAARGPGNFNRTWFGLVFRPPVDGLAAAPGLDACDEASRVVHQPHAAPRISMNDSMRLRHSPEFRRNVTKDGYSIPHRKGDSQWRALLQM